MKATAQTIDKNRTKLTIEVDKQEFEEAMQKSYLKNRKRITIPGFRKGKAPRKIIENNYGEGIFYEDAVNIICPKAYEEAVEETKIQPVDRPEIDIEQLGSGQNFIFTAEVTVKPDVTLGDYKGIEVVKTEYNVTEEDVENQIKSEQERNARWNTIEDRAVQDGDRVTIDFTGTVDGEEFEGGSAKERPLVIGSNSFIPGFEEQLIGANSGEEKDVNVTFPDDYHAEDLKGKVAVFKVFIHEIKEKELPELDDEFAKDVSEFDTLEEYKSDVREKLEKNAQERAKNEIENAAVAKAAENVDIDIPEAMVESELDTIMNDINYRMQYQGMTLDNYLKMTNTSLADYKSQFKDQANDRVKTQLVLEKIAEAENIEVNDEDIENEYKKMAEQYGRDIEEIKKQFSSSKAYLEEQVKVQKTIDFIVNNAVMVEKPAEETGNNDEDKNKE